MKETKSSQFKSEIAKNAPLQVVGTINAYSALMAKRMGFKAIYLSGGGVANASYGLPDLAITSVDDVLADVERITSACDLPLLVDIDTGWGGAFNIARAIKKMISHGAAAVHIEDQVSQKRCGHRPGKELVSAAEMVDRIKVAVDARTNDDFVIMARSDAFQNLGINETIDRLNLYVEAGADMIFPESLESLADFKAVTNHVPAPVLANITEFGKTPLFSVNQLKEVGVKLVLYPLSAFRAMNQAALKVYETIKQEQTQKSMVGAMQTREELYDFLDYHRYEKKLDALFAKQKK
ncbi:MAG: methylisocitrate lyase [SAR324 cluster bacterium]|nr:methylisocitrate lyase [SAR324 cluster bacterium]